MRFLLLFLAFCAPLCAQNLPSSATQQGPLETQSATRSRVVLNGLWNFQPATRSATAAPVGGNWGQIWVPGTWLKNGWQTQIGSLPGVAKNGNGENWNDLGRDLGRAWYEREIEIPAAFAGRQIVLDFRQVSTDATVFIGDQKAGVLQWPYGEIDITRLVVPGQKARLRLLVTATANAGESLLLMGDAPGQNAQVKSQVMTAGLIGDVLLLSRPQNARVSDVFVQTSTRKKRLDLQIELAGVTQSGPVEFSARLLDENGREEKQFSATVNVQNAPLQTLKIGWDWPNARLWDLDKPNLYTLQLRARGSGMDDEYPQRFGFREFWIEGRMMFLNGTPFRFRPLWVQEPATRGGIDGTISGLRGAGINIGQFWPGDPISRGEPTAQRSWFATRADERGFPLIGATVGLQSYLWGPGWKFIWNAENRERFRAAMERDLRFYRNHPSILLWGTTANVFNQAQDQNPRNVGRANYLQKETDTRAAGDEGLAAIRAFDPTRPIFTHAGNRVGDIYTTNHYLNLTPLQEREEWLSEWAKTGNKPFLAIEFGTPFNATFQRGRAGFGPSTTSEPLATEYAAIYEGPRAYQSESSEYRRAIRGLFDGKGWPQMQGNRAMNFNPPVQSLQSLFIRNTWRSWRADGLTGGMVPWAFDSILWHRNSGAKTPVAPFVPGALGAYDDGSRAWQNFYLRPEGGWETSDASRVLIEHNGPTLAFLAGAAPDHADKAHLFAPGARVQKQIALINDERTPQPFRVSWTTLLNGQKIGSGAASGTLSVGENRFLPLSFALPANFAGEKLGGQITLSAQIGARNHTDSFDFRISKPAPPLRGVRVALFDPQNKTAALLRALGVETTPWDGALTGANRPTILVLGRESLSSGAALPGGVSWSRLESWVQGGGRLVVMAQKPDWLRETLGLRVARHDSRRVWPVGQNPVAAGLDEADLRDWNGVSTLSEPYPIYKEDERLPYGWKWGNRGSVASGAIEKPHRAGWTPLFECEFDLAYSPLLELSHGAGKLWLCQFDLEDHAVSGPNFTPSAQKLARQFLNYAATSPLSSRRNTFYFGSDAGAALLQSLTTRFERLTVWNEGLGADTLAIVEPGAAVSREQLDAFTRRGGRVLVLPATQDGNVFGLDTAFQTEFDGAKSAPQSPVFAGLSVADLRSRAAYPARVLRGTGTQSEGVLAAQTVGGGQIVWAQLDPRAFDVEKEPFLRFTRWRHTRALTQILSNLGASFEADERVFRPQIQRVNLAGTWQTRFIRLLPAAATPDAPTADPGLSSESQLFVRPEAPATGWQSLEMPQMLAAFETQDGEAVLRREVEIPAAWVGQVLQLNLGALDDFDTVFWNGQPIGSTDKTTPSWWAASRRYRVPPNLVKAGKNTLAIRLYDQFGGGGMGGRAENLFLRVMNTEKAVSLYHSDYREDFEFGDDPYRYYRW